MATVFTCVFVALLVLVNVVTTMLFDRYPITIDLTTNKIYSVSNDTEDYVKKVNVDVQVTIFADENTYTNYSSYNKQAVELLKNYCKLNHHITYRFVDIDSHPEIVKEYTDTISQFDMIFETKTKVDGKEISRTRKLGMLDLLTFTDEFEQKLSQSGYSIDTLAQQAGGDLSFLSYYGSYVESSNAEQAFTSALMTVTDPNPVYVSILTGRSELTQLTYFQTLLTANGYNVNTVDITSEDIPSDTDVVVVPAPKTDYLEEDIKKVSDFLNNDGNLGKQLLYIASYGQEDTPNLDEFLSEYGLSVGKGVICESDSGKYYNSPCVTVASDVSDNFTQDVSTENPAILSALCRPVNTLFDEQAKYYSDIMDAIVKYADNISAVVVWGTTDDQSWRSSKYPLLFNEDYTAKPSYYQIVDGIDYDQPTTTTTTTAASTTATTTDATTTTTGGDILYGDANCDEKVDVSDAVMILQALANTDKYGVDGTDPTHITEQGMINADCNLSRDGVTTADALSVQKKVVGLIELPIE